MVLSGMTSVTVTAGGPYSGTRTVPRSAMSRDSPWTGHDPPCPGTVPGRVTIRQVMGTVPTAQTTYRFGVAIKIGTSGWSYPSWRPGFYPDGLQPAAFLSFYAERFDTVELNSTGYRLPSADQFRRWADAVPDGFEFSVKFSLMRLVRVTTFLERVLALGDRLGPVRVVYIGPRDDGTLSFVLGSIPEDARLARDFRAASWTPGPGGVPR